MQLTTTQVSLIAAYVTEPATRPDPFEAVSGGQWRRARRAG